MSTGAIFIILMAAWVIGRDGRTGLLESVIVAGLGTLIVKLLIELLA